MILRIHRKLTDKLNLTAVANDFVSVSEHRSTLFETFETDDFNIDFIMAILLFPPWRFNLSSV